MSKSLTPLQVSIEQIKEELSISFVMHHYGHEPARKDGNRLIYTSPFRVDNEPSFAIFHAEGGMQRWGDFAEKTQGSVVDLVQRLEGDIKLPAAMPVVRALYAEYLDADWDEEISPAERMAEIPPHVLMEDRELPLVSSTTRSKSLDALMSGRPSITLKTLATFGVRDGGHYLAAIYPDERAIRIRSANDKTFREGSKTSLYHAPGKGPSDLPTLPILLTEGESDTYAGYAAFGREMVVAGFSGTGQVGDKYITDLMGRQIVLGFDGDTSGRKFSRYWASKLKDAGCVVSILPVSEGRDLASYPVASLVELMGRRRQATINVTNLRAARDGYALANDDGSREDLVSNWWAEVSEILLSEDDHAYVLKVHSSEGPQDGTYTLEPQDLEHAAALARWCRKFNGSWWGDTTAVRKLVAELEEQSAYVPVTRTVGRPSLVKPGGFALPGLSISTDVQLDDSNMLVPTATPWPTARGEASADTLLKLYRMHLPKVTSPMLAWCAVAPLRTLYLQFPQLFVTGASGSGKTTLVEKMLRAMNNVVTSSALTSTTPYAVSVMMGSTNCLPVWFDEYRPGARRSALDTLNQTVRDAYTATSSPRGGLHDDKTKVSALRTDAPLVISGEDMADEQSHRDRLVRVVVPLKGKGMLPMLDDVDRLFAREYLYWLASRGEGFTASKLVRPPVVDAEPYLHLNDRQAWNLGLLDVGWDLLKEFAHYLSDGAVVLPPADWSGVLGMAEHDSGDRIMEFLNDMQESWGTQDPAMWVDERKGLTFVSSRQVLSRARTDKVDLPFTSARALDEHLIQNYGGVRTSPMASPRSVGRKARYIKITTPEREDNHD